MSAMYKHSKASDVGSLDWKGIRWPTATPEPIPEQAAKDQSVRDKVRNQAAAARQRDKDDMEREKISASLVDFYRQDLFYTLSSSEDASRPRTCILNLATMNRMLMHAAQYRLACDAEKLFNDPAGLFNNMETMEENVWRYCQAVKQMDFMQTCATRGFDDDPFKVKSDYTIEREILQRAGFIPGSMLPKGALPVCVDDKEPRLFGTSRTAAIEETSRKQMVERLVFALGGGLLLIAPMLIMVYVPGRAASVATTCAFMVFFGLLIALKSELRPHEMIAVTAAYAAVLVVFVGARLGSIGPL